MTEATKFATSITQIKQAAAAIVEAINTQPLVAEIEATITAKVMAPEGIAASTLLPEIRRIVAEIAEARRPVTSS